jgi:hypothetical protein
MQQQQQASHVVAAHEASQQLRVQYRSDSIVCGFFLTALMLCCACRRLDIPRAIVLINHLVNQQRQQLLQQHQQQQAAAHTGSSSSSMQRPLLHAFLEVASIMPTNGSLSTLNQGYSIGAWQALLLALGFEVCSVHAKQWKKGLGLIKAEKDDSRELAARLYASVGQCQQHIIRWVSVGSTSCTGDAWHLHLAWWRVCACVCVSSWCIWVHRGAVLVLRCV